jgi:hypothetical protein
MGNGNFRAPRAMVAGLWLWAGALLAACGGGTGTDPGDSVLVEGTSRVALTSSGGGLIFVPAGAACHYEATYDLAMTTGDLTWSVCRVHAPYDDPASFTVETGTRTLTAAERAQVTGQIRAVRVTENSNCGADKDLVQIAVDSPAGHRVYGDDFYSCLKTFDLYVESNALDNLKTALNALTLVH